MLFDLVKKSADRFCDFFGLVLEYGVITGDIHISNISQFVDIGLYVSFIEIFLFCRKSFINGTFGDAHIIGINACRY